MARPRTQRRFDPYAILAALEQERTTYILIGAFARVIEGLDEITLVDYLRMLTLRHVDRPRRRNSPGRAMSARRPRAAAAPSA